MSLCGRLHAAQQGDASFRAEDVVGKEAVLETAILAAVVVGVALPARLQMEPAAPVIHQEFGVGGAVAALKHIILQPQVRHHRDDGAIHRGIGVL